MPDSPFANIPPDKEHDFRFLLEKVYQGLLGELEVVKILFRGKLGDHETRLKNMENRAKTRDACPCPKHHDPATNCPLFLLENEFLRNKWRNAGIYTGFFTAGALFYYLAQLAMSAMKLGQP